MTTTLKALEVKEGDRFFWHANGSDSRFGETLPSRIYRVTRVKEVGSRGKWSRETETWEQIPIFHVDAIIEYQFNGLVWKPIKKSKPVAHSVRAEHIITPTTLKNFTKALEEQIKLLNELGTREDWENKTFEIEG